MDSACCNDSTTITQTYGWWENDIKKLFNYYGNLSVDECIQITFDSILHDRNVSVEYVANFIDKYPSAKVLSHHVKHLNEQNKHDILHFANQNNLFAMGGQFWYNKLFQ